MCGIAGKIYFKGQPVSKTELELMGSFLQKRGPDAEGFWLNENTGFMHRRLSIIDLSSNGNQPMEDVSKRLVITYNGEIYNYLELAKELQQFGFSFHSKSDTEVILNGFLHWGIEKLLGKLDGMFAFVLLDKYTKEVYACRDRFGKKPLYYFYNRDRFSFSSDIRSIWATEQSLTLDHKSIDYFLSELTVPQPQTIWQEVKQIQPAHFLKINVEHSSLTEQCYWKMDFHKKLYSSLEETEYILEEKLIQSIMKRTVGDVPVACFLSGGTDSGLIASILATHSSERINTFSVGVTDIDLNELPLARKLSERYNTHHTEIIVEPEVMHLLPELIENFGEPFADSSNIPSYYISKEMGKEYKVALSGDGGDELFGGYYDYRWAFLADAYFYKYPKKLQRNIQRSFNYLFYQSGLTKLNLGLLEHYQGLPGGLKLYRQMGFHPDEKSKLYAADFTENKMNFTKTYLNKLWQDANQLSITDNLFEASFKTRLLNDYLVKVDRTSMMNSVEVRSPFLDYRLAEFAAMIPNRYKFNKGIQKYLLKKLAVKYIDKDFFSRTKKGFGIPLHSWLKSELKEYVEDIIFSGELESRKIFNMEYIRKMIKDHQLGKHNHANRIWAILCLELWFKKFWRG